MDDKIHRTIWNRQRGYVGFQNLHARVAREMRQMSGKALRVTGHRNGPERDVQLCPRIKERLQHPAPKKAGGSGEKHARTGEAAPKPADMADHIVEVILRKRWAHMGKLSWISRKLLRSRPEIT